MPNPIDPRTGKPRRGRPPKAHVERERARKSAPKPKPGGVVLQLVGGGAKGEDDEPQLTARQLELEQEIQAADAEHRRLLADPSSEYSHLRQTHLAGSLAWTLRSTLCFELGLHDAARKAASTADDHAKMAAKLEQASAIDRLNELEKMLKGARRDAERLAKLR